MIDPNIKIGFIIVNPDWKEEIPWSNGHKKTAFEWIKKNNLMDLYNKVKEKSEPSFDEKEFLINYIGAIKLYAQRGHFYCLLPNMLSIEKTYLKHYYKNMGYQIIENSVFDEEFNPKVKKYEIPYNQTVVKTKNGLSYNPYKSGD